MPRLSWRGGAIGPAFPGPPRRRRPGYAEIVDHAARLSVIGLFLLVLLYAAIHGRYFLVPVSAALIVGFTFGPTVDWLERHRVPSYLASTLLIALIGIAFYGLYLAFALPLQDWVKRMPEIWQNVTGHLRNLREPLEKLDEVSKQVEQAAGGSEAPMAVKVEQQSMVATLLTFGPPIVAQFMLFGATLFFFMANRSRLRANLLSFCVTREIRLRAARIIRDTEYLLSRYVAAITIVNLCLGAATATAMYLLSVPSPALWGALAAVLNFIPYLGPAGVMAILVGVGVATYDTLAPALTPAIVFLGLNLVEGQFVTPAVVGRNLTLNPFLVFIALGFWLWIWGPVGAFVAVPMLLIGAVLVNHLLPRRLGTTVPFGKPAAAARKARNAA